MGEPIDNKMVALGKIGGKKSGETRRRKGEIKDLALSILSVKIKYPRSLKKMLDEIGVPTDKKQNIWASIYMVQALKALSGDLKSAYFCADVAGISPRALEQKAKIKMIEKMAENSERLMVEPSADAAKDIDLEAIDSEAEKLGIYGND